VLDIPGFLGRSETRSGDRLRAGMVDSGRRVSSQTSRARSERGTQVTVPEPCPECHGSRSVIILLEEPPYPVDNWRLYSEVGFLQVPCRTCRARGCLELESPPSIDPRIWEHQVPPEVRRQVRLDREEQRVLVELRAANDA